MRHPRTHSFLKWAGPAVVVFVGASLGLIAALASAFDGVKKWAEDLYAYVEPTLAAPSFLVLSAGLILGYVAALIWTALPRRPEPDPIPAAPIIVGPEEPPQPKPARGKYELTDEALAGLQRVLDGGKEAEESRIRKRGWFLDWLMRSKANTDNLEAALHEREKIEELRRSSAGTLPKSRGAMEYGDYWKEAGAEWIELLFLREEASLGRPVAYWQTTMGHNEAFDLLNDLRQAGVDGTVAFRGRSYDYDRPEMLAKTVPLTDIPKEHFHEFEFALGGFIGSDSNYMTFVGKHEFVPTGVKKTYRDIRANREQLREWWRLRRQQQRDG